MGLNGKIPNQVTQGQEIITINIKIIAGNHIAVDFFGCRIWLNL